MPGLDGQTVLVTGAAGWLGQSLLHALTDGLSDCAAFAAPARTARIRAFVLPHEAAALDGFRDAVDVVTGDLRRPEDCTRFCARAGGAILFHLAGIIHPRRVREFYEVNLQGTEHVLAAAADASVARAVVMSSNSPLGVNQMSFTLTHWCPSPSATEGSERGAPHRRSARARTGHPIATRVTSARNQEGT